jgi:hypothetical protein
VWWNVGIALDLPLQIKQTPESNSSSSLPSVVECLGSLKFSLGLYEDRKFVLWSWMGRQSSCKL